MLDRADQTIEMGYKDIPIQIGRPERSLDDQTSQSSEHIESETWQMRKGLVSNHSSTPPRLGFTGHHRLSCRYLNS